MPQVETNTKSVVERLTKDAWRNEGGAKHTKFAHPDHPGVRIMVPRHKSLTPGVARSIAKAAGWI